MAAEYPIFLSSSAAWLWIRLRSCLWHLLTKKLTPLHASASFLFFLPLKQNQSKYYAKIFQNLILFNYFITIFSLLNMSNFYQNTWNYRQLILSHITKTSIIWFVLVSMFLTIFYHTLISVYVFYKRFSFQSILTQRRSAPTSRNFWLHHCDRSCTWDLKFTYVRWCSSTWDVSSST